MNPCAVLGMPMRKTSSKLTGKVQAGRLAGWPGKCSKSVNEKNLSVTGPYRPKFRPPDDDP